MPAEQTEENQGYWNLPAKQEWFRRQFRHPYRDTIAFERFVSSRVDLDAAKTVMELGCGSGAVLYYFATRYPNVRFDGFDINSELFAYCEDVPANMSMAYGDLYDTASIPKPYPYDGLISARTLSWLPDHKRAIEQMCAVGTQWIAMTSLFWPGMIDYIIRLENHEYPDDLDKFSESNCSVFSVKLIEHEFGKYGYRLAAYEPFEMDQDFPPRDTSKMGTYTIRTEDGHRLRFNTCLHLPEAFLLLERS